MELKVELTRGVPHELQEALSWPYTFPRVDVSEGSPVASACGDVFVSVVSSSDNFKPLPPKKRKIQVKIGDYSGIHSKTMGDSHVPCRIVGEFGGQFQLYCSKGVLNVSFSSSELIPLTTCASIPLDKWRQAPKVSLRSLTRQLLSIVTAI